MNDEAALKELIDDVMKMRDAQKRFYRSKNAFERGAHLREAKELELQVDQTISRLCNTPTLWEEGDAE